MEPSAAQATQRREGNVRDNSRLAALETWHIRQAQTDAAAAAASAAAPAVLSPPPGYAAAAGVASASASRVPDDAPPAYDAGMTAPSKAEKTAENVQPSAPFAANVDDEALTQSTPLLGLG